MATSSAYVQVLRGGNVERELPLRRRRLNKRFVGSRSSIACRYSPFDRPGSQVASS